MGKCKCDCGITLNSLKCAVYKNRFAKNELCGKEKAAGIWMWEGKEKSKKSPERRKLYWLLNVESHIRMCHEPVQGN